MSDFGDQVRSPRCAIAWHAAQEILDDICMERMSRRAFAVFPVQGPDLCPRATINLEDEIPF